VTRFIFDLITSSLELEVCCYSECYNWNDEQMWRDILIITAFVLAGLTYFGLTPRRLSEYAETAKGEIAKRSLYQKAAPFLMFAATLFYLFSVIWEFETFGWSNSLMLISILLCLWGGIMVWQLSERKAKVVRVVAYSALLPVLVAGVILSDMLLWQKLVYPLGGAGIGFGLGRLTDYVDAKLKSRRSLEEENK